MLLSEAEQQFATTEQTLKEREQLFSREKQSLIAEKQVQGMPNIGVVVWHWWYYQHKG